MTALGAALSAALLRELVEHHRLLNASLFRGALTTPRVELVPVESRLVRWVPSSRTIEISSSLVVREPWGTVVEARAIVALDPANWAPAPPQPDLPDLPAQPGSQENDPALLLLPPLELEPKQNP